MKPAFAGHWEKVANPYTDAWGNPPSTNDPDYNLWLAKEQDRKDGEASYDLFQQDASGLTEYQDSMDWASHPDGYGTGFSDTMTNNIYGGSIHHQTIGKICTIFQWVRDLDPITMEPDENDNPPDFLPLKITASAWAAAGSDLSMQSRNTSKEQVAVSVMGEGPTSSDSDYEDWMSGAYLTSNSVHAKKLVLVPTKGNDVVQGPWVNLGATATVDGDRVISHYDEMMGSWDEYLPGGTRLALTYDAQEDNRKLFLHRANAINETTDEDGTVHGDTTYSYASLTVNGTVLCPNQQTFTPTFAGSWTGGTSNPTVTWNWDPSSDFTSYSKTSGTWEAPYGNLGRNDITSQWTGSTTAPQTVTITYSAKDNGDGATATKNYVLTLHDPVEKVSDDVSTVTAEGPLWGSGGGNALFRVDGPKTAGSVSINQGHGSSQGWGVTGSAGTDVSIGEFLIPLGIDVNYQSSKDTNISFTVDLDINVPADTYTYPMFKHGYNRHITSFRHFLPSGEHVIGDGTELHKVSHDVWVTESVFWHSPIDSSVPAPEFNPSDPPAIPVEPDL